MKTKLLLLALAAMLCGANVMAQKSRSAKSAKQKVVTNTTGKNASTKGCSVTHPQVVDLGLPSGTLWADRNVGAEAPYAYGGLYRYGNKGKMSGEGTPTYDIIGTTDDTARNKLGKKWCMPSREQLEELFDCCSREKVTDHGVLGFRLTGPNGTTIFFPLTGLMYNYGRSQAGTLAMYQSGEVLESDMYVVGQEVYVLQFWEKDDDVFRCCVGSESKGTGNPIRAVVAK